MLGRHRPEERRRSLGARTAHGLIFSLSARWMNCTEDYAVFIHQIFQGEVWRSGGLDSAVSDPSERPFEASELGTDDTDESDESVSFEFTTVTIGRGHR